MFLSAGDAACFCLPALGAWAMGLVDAWRGVVRTGDAYLLACFAVSCVAIVSTVAPAASTNSLFSCPSSASVLQGCSPIVRPHHGRHPLQNAGFSQLADGSQQRTAAHCSSTTDLFWCEWWRIDAVPDSPLHLGCTTGGCR